MTMTSLPTSAPWQRLRRVACLATCVGFVHGCDSTPLTFQGLDTPPAVDQLVTPELLGALDSDGHFRLATPDPTDGREISVGRAFELALAYVHTFGPYLRSFLERGHGASIDFESLQAGRSYYAVSPYGEVPEPLHPGVKKGLGAYYLVHLRSPAGHAVSVAVSSLSTDVTTVDGNIRYPSSTGNDFLAIGIPTGAGEQRPMSPEQAVQIAFEATGLRTAALPVLVLPGRPFEPQSARWSLRLERSAAFLGVETGRRLSAASIYVDHRGGLYVPLLDQPGSTTVVDLDTSGRYAETTVPIRGDVPTVFERVVSAEREVP